MRATQAALVDARGEVRERAVRFTGEIAGHFAVIAEPARVPALGLTAVLCSAHHAGPNRMFVELARRWAARGVTTVRLDLQGLGETRGPLPRPLPDAALYSTQLERHLPAALEQLATAGLPPRFILGGYCAGAYWALQAALSVDRVAAAMVINLYAVTYSPQLVAERGAVEDLEGLGGRAWQRLRQGRVTSGDLRRVARRIRTGYLGAGGTRPAERAQRVHTAQALDRLRERDVQTLVVLAEDEPLVGQLRQAGALAQTNPWPNVAVDVIPGRDHLMLQLEVQRLVHASLDRALVRLLAG